MQIWIHDSKMKKIVALNNDIPEMLHYSNSAWHPYLEQATSTFDFTIPKFVNGKLHEDIKLITDECFVSFYINGSHQVFYIATLQEDDFNIQLTCNNTNLEYALEYANPFSVDSAQTIEWYLNHMDLLSFAAVELGYNEIPDSKRTLTFDSQETKMARLQSLMSNFDAEFEFKVDLNRDGTYKRIVINIYQKSDETHHGIGSVRGDVVLYYDNGLKGAQVTSDKTQMFNAGVFTGKDGLSLADVEISEKNADGIEEYYSRKGNVCLYAPLAMARYPATMRSEEQDNWIRKDFTTEYENINDLKAYALRTLKQYAYPLMTYTASVQSNFIGQYTDLKLGDTVKIIDKNFAGGLALEARVSEMIISFDNPTNNSLVFTNYRRIDNKPTSALQSRIEKAVEDRLPYRIELATTGGTVFKNGIGRSTVKPILKQGDRIVNATYRFVIDGTIKYSGLTYDMVASDITEPTTLTIAAWVDNKEVASEEVTFLNVSDGKNGERGPKGEQGPQGADGTDAPTIFVKSHTFSADSRAEIKLTGPNAFKKTVYNRGHNVWVLDVATHKLKEFVSCDTYTTMSFIHNGTSTTLADYLASLTDSIVVIAASDADSIDPDTRNVLDNMGGSPEVGTWESQRVGHVFIGMSKRSDGTWPLQPRQGYEVAIPKDGSTPEIGCSLSNGGIVANGATGPKGDKGEDGIAGKDGVGLKSTVITYGLSDSEDTPPTSWSNQVPALTKGKYLWTKTVWTYTDNTSETGYQKTYIAKDGNDGADGIAGKDGVGIKTTTITYAVGTSGTTAPTSGWTSQVPNVPAGQYLWTKTVWEYTDNTNETGYSVAKMGERGPQGPQGERGLQGPKGDQGIPGVKGADGKTQYTHIAYADTVSGSGFSQTDTNKAFIGMYQDFEPIDSNDPTKYRWSKLKGDEGAPGKPGADGKTSYFHMAYADSADGRTGFSFKESGQQYQGYYTDFTQTSSTDPNNYTWMDRRAGVEVGSNNLLRKTAINTENLNLFYKSGTEVSVVDKDGHQVYKLVVSSSDNAGAYFNGNTDYYNLIKDRNYTFSFWVLTNKDKDYNMYSLGHIQAFNSNSDKVGDDISHQHTQPVYSTNVIKANTWTKVWCTFKATSNSFFRPFFWYLTAGDEIYIYDMMLNEGTIPLSHSLAPEDSQEQIDSKADQTLTQQQLNALAEKNNLIKAEMEAKASIDTVNQWITAYQNYVTANDDAQDKSEKALQDASARLLQLNTDVGDLKRQWTFIDTYMTVQNEGLIIGKSDGSAYAKFSNDRISLFSGGSEVMYISQGVLRIENGIFTKTIQIGRFRFETHPADKDTLVLRYLGGV